MPLDWSDNASLPLLCMQLQYKPVASVPVLHRPSGRPQWDGMGRNGTLFWGVCSPHASRTWPCTVHARLPHTDSRLQFVEGTLNPLNQMQLPRISPQDDCKVGSLLILPESGFTGLRMRRIGVSSAKSQNQTNHSSDNDFAIVLSPPAAFQIHPLPC